MNKQEIIRRVLDGQKNLIVSMFRWSESPQGEDFWADQSVKKKLNPEGIRYLEQLVSEGWDRDQPLPQPWDEVEEFAHVETQERPSAMNDMNESTAVFLLFPENARAIMVSYMPKDEARKSRSGSPYDADPVMFKTFDPNIKLDDYVVVETDSRWKMTVCKVVEVDVDINIKTTQDVKWIVGVVNRVDFDELKKAEATAIAKIRRARNRREREELRKDLDADGEASEELKALPILSGGIAAVESPVPTAAPGYAEPISDPDNDPI